MRRGRGEGEGKGREEGEGKGREEEEGKGKGSEGRMGGHMDMQSQGVNLKTAPAFVYLFVE